MSNRKVHKRNLRVQQFFCRHLGYNIDLTISAAAIGGLNHRLGMRGKILALASNPTWFPEITDPAIRESKARKHFGLSDQ